MGKGFKREELRSRYDVSSIEEDAWHAYTGSKTSELLSRLISEIDSPSLRLLNAGAGIYSLQTSNCDEYFVDLFSSPIAGRKNAVCGSIELLPFRDEAFGCIVCVGEVLSYCDPAIALKEFERILAPVGYLVLDFGSTRSIRRWLTKMFGRTADIAVDEYNGSAERVWRYSPSYIRELLQANGFQIRKTHGVHTWSVLAKRLGLSQTNALKFQERLDWLNLPVAWAEIITIAAVKSIAAK